MSIMDLIASVHQHMFFRKWRSSLESNKSGQSDAKTPVFVVVQLLQLLQLLQSQAQRRAQAEHQGQAGPHHQSHPAEDEWSQPLPLSAHPARWHRPCCSWTAPCWRSCQPDENQQKSACQLCQSKKEWTKKWMCVFNTIMYIYIYVYIVPPTKKKTTFLRSQRFWDKLPCSVWVPVGGTIYIYTHTHMRVLLLSYCWTQVLRAILSPEAFANVCKRVQGPKYLDWLRIQDSRFKIQDSRFKIQKKLLESRG